jgi:hypothetical protein
MIEQEHVSQSMSIDSQFDTLIDRSNQMQTL